MTIQQPNFGKLLKLISTQADEEQLRLMGDAINRKYKVLRAQRSAEVAQHLEIGTRVIFRSGIRPQYLERQTGTVTEFRTSKVRVKLDRGPVGKFWNGEVVAPPSVLQILVQKPETTTFHLIGGLITDGSDR